MKSARSIIHWLLGIWFVVLGSTPAMAVIIDVTGTDPVPVQFDVPASPPNPNIPGLTSYLFDLNSFFPTAFPGQTSPNVLPKGLFAENAMSFSLALISLNPIVASQIFQFHVKGSSWSVQATLEYAAAKAPVFDSDVLTLSGEATHLIAPHAGEQAPGDPVPYKVELHGARSLTLTEAGVPVTNAELQRILKQAEIPSGGRFGIETNAKTHPDGPDQDLLLAQLRGKVANPSIPFISNEIEFWDGGVAGMHTPEPSTFVSLGCGLAALGWFRRTRRGRDLPKARGRQRVC